MKYATYESKVATRIQWLNEIPRHWGVERLKTVATYCVSNVDKVPADNELPVRLCNYTDVYYNDLIEPDMGLMQTTATVEEIRKFGLRVNDVVITKDSEDWRDIAVAAMVVKSAPDLVCGYHLAIVRPNAKQIYGPFLLRLFESSAVNQQFQIAASGVTRYGLPKSAIGEAWLPLPPINEQQSIARFLDAKTAQIDELIAKKRLLIDKLKEKRQALIARTVTRGLPPEAARAAGLESHPEMKDSGVEWLGVTPNAWQVKRLGFMCSKIGSGKTPSGGAETYEDSGVVFLRSQNVYDEGLELSDVAYINDSVDAEMRNSRVEDFDVLLNITGASIGRSCLVPPGFPAANVNQHVCIIRLSDKSVSEFVAWVLKTPFIKSQIDAAQSGAAREGLNFDQISKFLIALPDKNERKAICKYLGCETLGIDRLISSTDKAITHLTEYRQALITSAVTGKIDVRATA